MSTELRILRRKQIQDLTGLSRSSIYQRIADGEFPRSVPLGSRAVGWIESEVAEWLRSRVAARTNSDNTARSASPRSNKEAAA